MKLQRALVATLVFAAALAIVYTAHVRLFRVDVVLYASVADAVVAVALAGPVLWLSGYFAPLNGFEKTQLLLIWILAGYAFAISGPTVIDRSLSFYILEKIQQRGGAIKQERLDDIFTKEYVREHRLMDVRLTEQLTSGTLVIVDGCVRLTEKGQAVASFGRFFRKHLLPKQRLLMGEYSDALTDPFRNGEPLPASLLESYKCK